MDSWLLFTFEGNIQWAKNVSTSGVTRNTLTVINKIVFTSPEAKVELSGGKLKPLRSSKPFEHMQYFFERSIMRPIVGTQANQLQSWTK